MKRSGLLKRVEARSLLGSALVAGAAFSVGSAGAAPLKFMARVASSEPVSFTVFLPMRDRAGLEALVARQNDPSSPLYHHWLTPQQVEAQYGPTPAAIASVSNALRQRGLAVTTQGHMLSVFGRASQVSGAFATNLARGQAQSGAMRSYAMTKPALPKELIAARALVVGLDSNIHEAHTNWAKTAESAAQVLNPANRYTQDGPYWYGDLKQAYQYPSYQTMITRNGQKVRLDGTGATVGILMNSDIYDTDMTALFEHEHFRTNSGQTSDPALYKRVAIDGGATTESGALVEASIDTQQALSGAPGAHVILYKIPSLLNSEMLAGYGKIVAENEADIVSASFGECELFLTPGYNYGQDYTSYFDIAHETFLQGNAQGMTFVASSGDEAGLACPDTNYTLNSVNGRLVPSVEWPATDPNVTGVGGTNVVTAQTDGSLDSTYAGENAYSDPYVTEDPLKNGATVNNALWGATGGLSVYYPKPGFQSAGGINTGSTSFRAVPDVGMQVGGCPNGAAVPCNGGNSVINGNGNADRSAVAVYVNGEPGGYIGTSVAAPEFAGALALLVEKSGRQGNVNNYLYALGAAQSATGSNNPARSTTTFHRSIPGYNGVVTNNQPVNGRGKYYNYTTGVGTPFVYRLVGVPDAAVAGVPQTASNP